MKIKLNTFDSTPFGLIEDSNWENWFRTGNTNEQENELISKCEKFRSQFWLNAIDQHSNWLFDWKCDWLSCRSRIWNSIDWPTQRHTYTRSHTHSLNQSTRVQIKLHIFLWFWNKRNGIFRLVANDSFAPARLCFFCFLKWIEFKYIWLKSVETSTPWFICNKSK